MTRYLSAAFLGSIALLSLSSPALAQCDPEDVSGGVNGNGQGGSYIRAAGSSYGPSSGCPNNGHLQVETWIPTAPNSDWKETILPASQGATSVSRYNGNVWGLHRVESKHHQVYQGTFGVSWSQFDDNFDGVDLGNPPPDPPVCVIDNGTCDGGGQMDENCNCQYSPLLISINNRSLRFTAPQDGVVFDINADGTPDLTAWTRADSDDAFLVLDRNGNGLIDDGSELFGTATRKLDGSLAANGFDALRDLDSGPLSDGRLDYRDLAYSRMRLWTDTNHNGLSEPTELISLPTAGVEYVYTGYEAAHRVDRFGNSFKFKGWAFIRSQPWAAATRRRIFDVYFSVQN